MANILDTFRKTMFGEIFVGFIVTILVFYLFGCIGTFIYRVCKQSTENFENSRITRVQQSIGDWKLILVTEVEKSEDTAA